jgi:hypothetical protein
MHVMNTCVHLCAQSQHTVEVPVCVYVHTFTHKGIHPPKPKCWQRTNSSIRACLLIALGRYRQGHGCLVIAFTLMKIVNSWILAGFLSTPRGKPSGL